MRHLLIAPRHACADHPRRAETQQVERVDPLAERLEGRRVTARRIREGDLHRLRCGIELGESSAQCIGQWMMVIDVPRHQHTPLTLRQRMQAACGRSASCQRLLDQHVHMGQAGRHEFLMRVCRRCNVHRIDASQQAGVEADMHGNGGVPSQRLGALRRRNDCAGEPDLAGAGERGPLLEMLSAEPADADQQDGRRGLLAQLRLGRSACEGRCHQVFQGASPEVHSSSSRVFSRNVSMHDQKPVWR